MQPGYLFNLDTAKWSVVAFVLATTFLSGVLGGYLFGLARALRHLDDSNGSRSIWTYEDEE
jgi:hypothetical protein